MLWLSENPQASLDIFSQPLHHPAGFCIHRKAINKDKPTHPLAYCPPGSRVVCADYLAHLLRLCTRLLMVLPSRQQIDSSASCPVRIVLEDCHIIRMGRFIPVYRLGEDGYLLQGRCGYAFGLGVKSSLL